MRIGPRGLRHQPGPPPGAAPRRAGALRGRNSGPKRGPPRGSRGAAPAGVTPCRS